jgi:hypothetical protein
MTEEIPFSQVKIGESFFSNRTKRAFGGIKIKPIHDNDKGIWLTAIIMTDHGGCPSHDAGTAISLEPDRIVQVERQKKYRIRASRHDILEETIKEFEADPTNNESEAKERFRQVMQDPQRV